jgi:hypothetical protein
VENTALFTIEAFVFGYQMEEAHRHLIHVFCGGILQAMFPETKRMSISQNQGSLHISCHAREEASRE